jgi:hypothetical protein
MNLIPLVPPPGLDSDDTSFAAHGRWSDGSNVRPYNGGMQTLGAYSTAITLDVLESITDLTVVANSFGGPHVVIGAGGKLWATPGFGSPSDITPVSGVTADFWSFAPFGNTLLCNNGALAGPGALFQWTIGGGAATLITQAPASIVRILVSHRQVLALGCNEEISTTFNGRCIRGSDVEDSTDWTTSSTNNAFEFILDDEGAIKTGENIGNYIAILTSTSLWMGTFVGNPEQVWQFERIEGATGTIGASPHSCCVANGMLYWLGSDLQFWSWAPGSLPAPLPCPISRDFRDNLDTTDYLRLVSMPHFGEIWLFYADKRDLTDFYSRYIAFNKEGQWFRGILRRDAVCTSGLATGFVQATDQSAGGGFLAAVANVVYKHEVSSGTTLDWFLESANQYMSNGGQRMMIRSIIPDFQDQGGDVALTIVTKDHPQSTAVTKGTYTLTAGAPKKDFRASGKLISIKFSGSSYMRLGKPCIDVTPMGAR